MKTEIANLLPHQEFCVKHIINNNYCGLLLDMGLGKTLATLTALTDLWMCGVDLGKVLVIAPLSVCKNTWPAEITKWEHTRHLKIVDLCGSAMERVKSLKQQANIYIINRDNVKPLVDYLGNKWCFDTVVIDELSSFKASSSQRFRALRKIRPKIKRLIGLAGTPAPNNLIDLWSQVYLLDGGERLGKGVGQYQKQYFYPAGGHGHIIYKWLPRKGAEEQIYKNIGDICVSMKLKDHVAMPDIVYNEIAIELDEKTKKHYKDFKRKSVLELGGADIIASNAAVLVGKLLQFTGGAVYTKGQMWEGVHRAKLDKLVELVELQQGKPILVFYNYKHELQRILQVLPNAVDFGSEPNVVDKWNRGFIEVLLAHPQSAGHGLNLQDGGCTIVWVTLTWSLELYQQANARLYRQGQKHTTVVHHLLCKGTVDEQVMEVLKSKDTTQESLLAALRAEL